MASDPQVNPLIEECTIDPKSPLPSFLEMNLLESATSAANKALSESVDAFFAYMTNLGGPNILDSSNNSWGRKRIFRTLSQLMLRFGPYRAEICCLLTYVIERQIFCSEKGASVSESLYGLKRSKVFGGKEGRLGDMKKADQIRSALVFALGPYMRRKLDGYYERERDRGVSRDGSTIGERLGSVGRRESSRKLFVYMYPFLRMTHEGTQLAYHCAYLIGRSVYYTPYFHALRLILRRNTQEDVNQVRTSNEVNVTKSVKQHDLGKIRNAASMCFLFALAAGWIAGLQREARRRRRLWITQQLSKAKGAIVENSSQISEYPPPLPLTTDNDARIPNDYSLCPLCSQKRINPVATTSGFVFCYRCLVKHIREKGSFCPLTKIPIQEGQEIRLYEST